MKRKIACLFLATIALFPATSCGTLLFPERQHELHSGKLDPNVVLLDALGLLLWIVPGLVSFGVDFYTGSIYLPPGVERGEGPFFGRTGAIDEITE